MTIISYFLITLVSGAKLLDSIIVHDGKQCVSGPERDNVKVTVYNVRGFNDIYKTEVRYGDIKADDFPVKMAEEHSQHQKKLE